MDEKSRDGKIKQITESILTRLLYYKMSFDVAIYIKELRNWRELEETIDAENSPFIGLGIIASKKNVEEWSKSNETILNEEYVASFEVSDELDSFPLEETAMVYLFTIVEDYGNQILKLVDPNYGLNRKAWHHRVRDEEEDINKTIEGFISPFKVIKKRYISKKIISSFLKLKTERNKIVHGEQCSIKFNEAFSISIATICHLYYLITNSKDNLRVFPWQDFDGKYQQSVPLSFHEEENGMTNSSF